MPVARKGVFVAFTDGTSAMFVEGERHPVWRRPLSLSPHSYLSASPSAITAATQDGVLHVLDPASGETRWSRKAKTIPWHESWWWSIEGVIRQDNDVVFVPDRVDDKARRLRCFALTTGQELWSHRPGHCIHSLEIGAAMVILGSDAGAITAVSRQDGSTLWRRELQMAAINNPRTGFQRRASLRGKRGGGVGAFGREWGNALAVAMAAGVLSRKAGRTSRSPAAPGASPGLPLLRGRLGCRGVRR